MESTSPTSTGPTPSSVGIRYGILIGLVSIIFSMILFMTDSGNSGWRWLGLGITIGGMVLAHNYYKQQHTGYMDYGQGLTIGAVMSLVGGILNTLFSSFYMNFIDTDYMGRMASVARAEMEAKGQMSDEQIDQAMSMMQKFTSPTWFLVFGIVGSLFFGFIIALIVSAITKHSRPEFE